MKFSAKGEYGVRAILDIALYGEREPVRVRDIAQRQGIPLRFLEQVMSSLKKARLVDSYRGAQGGYRLARKAAEISLADIVQAVEGPITLMECIGEADKGTCDQVSMCVIRDVWRDVQNSMVQALAGVSLASVVERKSKLDAQSAPTFQI